MVSLGWLRGMFCVLRGYGSLKTLPMVGTSRPPFGRKPDTDWQVRASNCYALSGLSHRSCCSTQAFAGAPAWAIVSRPFSWLDLSRHSCINQGNRQLSSLYSHALTLTLTLTHVCGHKSTFCVKDTYVIFSFRPIEF